jgi:hypothetical protein
MLLFCTLTKYNVLLYIIMILTIRSTLHDLTVPVQNITNNISLSQQCQKMLILFLKKNNNSNTLYFVRVQLDHVKTYEWLVS